MSTVFLLIVFLPIIGAAFLLIPKPVLGGATLILFGTIAVAGIRILASEPIGRKKVYIMAVSFGLGLGVTLVPDATQHLPDVARQVFATPITLSGLSAIILTLLIPEDKTTAETAGTPPGTSA